jgi:3-methyladenine DNA glycosylase AlkD
MMAWHDEMFELLEGMENPEKAAEMAAYMKNYFPFLGVQKPALEKVIRPYLKNASKEAEVDWEFVDICWGKEYREAQYIGTEYLYCIRKKLSKNDLDKIKRLVTIKPWWDVTDSLDEVVGYLVFTYPELKATMLTWAKDKSIWVRRIAIDHQLQRKEDTDAELLEKIIVLNLGTNEFFITKAIGWSLRDYSKVAPQWVSSFVTRYRDRLSALSIKEASKYL